MKKRVKRNKIDETAVRNQTIRAVFLRSKRTIFKELDDIENRGE